MFIYGGMVDGYGDAVRHRCEQKGRLSNEANAVKEWMKGFGVILK